jgi:ABC-type multidrug transport system ATPase subunit
MQIRLKSLTKWFGTTPALSDVSLGIEPGESVAILGLNGAGKTTLLRCLIGIAAPDAGEILYDGETFERDRVDLRKRMFFLPDFPLANPGVTVIRHIDLILRLYECDRSRADDQVIELLRELDMLPYIDAPVDTLSRGQAYKTTLAALLAVDPELWMFDEPFASGMDPAGLNTFRRHARDALSRGRTVLFTTQLLPTAEFADRICVLHQGRVCAFDRVDRIREQDFDGNVTEALEQLFADLREESP